MADDLLEIVMRRHPAEFRPGAVGIGDDAGGIAGAPAALADGEVCAMHRADDVEHLTDGVAEAVADIGDDALAAGAQPVERREMGGDDDEPVPEE